MKKDIRYVPEYRAWWHMKTRCYNENYPLYHRYGGRGIKVCKRWLHDYKTFYKDMGPRPSAKHSLDRVNNDKDYKPSNCRWATPEEQMNNTSRNQFYTLNGKTQTASQWAREYNIDWRILWQRINRDGKTLEEAIKPSKRRSGKTSNG